MSVKKFLVPKDHVLKEIFEFGNELASYSGKSNEFVFDFQGKGLDTPFGMLFTAFAVQQFINAHPDAACKPVNSQDWNRYSYARWQTHLHCRRWRRDVRSNREPHSADHRTGN